MELYIKIGLEIRKAGCLIFGHRDESVLFTCWSYGSLWERIERDAVLCRRCGRVEIPDSPDIMEKIGQMQVACITLP